MAAPTFATKTTGVDTDGGSSSSISSLTLTANRLYVLFVSSRTSIGGGTTPNTPTATSTGATWTRPTGGAKVGTIEYDNSSSSRRKLTVLYTMVSSDQTSAITIDFGGQNQTDVSYVLLESDANVNTKGSGGTPAVRQSVVASNASASSLSATLLDFMDTANSAVVAGFANSDDAATRTQGTGFTLLGESGNTTNGCRVSTEYKTGEDLGADFSWSAASEVGGIALEILGTGLMVDTYGVKEGTDVNSLTQSVTVAYANSTILVGPAAYDSTNYLDTRISSVTYNGVSLTQLQVDAPADSGDGASNYLYAISDIAAGTANLVVTFAGTCTAPAFSYIVMYHTGGLQTAIDTSNKTDTTGTTQTASLTTTADNTRVWSWCGFDNNGSGTASGTDQIQSSATASGYVVASYSQTIKTTAGSVSHSYTNGGSDSAIIFMASVKSITASTTKVFVIS